MTVRASFPIFAIANDAYIAATVSLYTVDGAGSKTAVLATLYSAATGAGTLSNPQTLDSEGKLAQAVYVETAVIAAITSASVADHDTGIYHPTGSWRSDWATATLYYAGEYVRAGGDADGTNDIYSVEKTHTSDVFATDVSGGNLALAIDISFFSAVGATLSGIDALSPVANEMIYANGADSFAVTALTAYMRTLLDDANSATALATLVAAGTAIANTFSGINTFNAQVRFKKGADIASASPLVLGTDGNDFDVTGSVPFSQITVSAGTWFMLHFVGSPLLMTDGAPLDLAGQDLNTTNGGRGLFYATADDTVVMVNFQHEFVRPLAYATQAEMEAGTATAQVVTAAKLQYGQGSAKAWVEFDGTAVDGVADLAGVNVSYNVSSVVDVAAGDHTINFTTAFSTADYSFAPGTRLNAGSTEYSAGQHVSVARTASAFRCNTTSNNVAADMDVVSFVFYGDK